VSTDLYTLALLANVLDHAGANNPAHREVLFLISRGIRDVIQDELQDDE
jgi:hypothetical protein